MPRRSGSERTNHSDSGDRLSVRGFTVISTRVPEKKSLAFVNIAGSFFLYNVVDAIRDASLLGGAYPEHVLYCFFVARGYKITGGVPNQAHLCIVFAIINTVR